MSHVLLFGASGFIGRHVRAALDGDDRVDQVTCLGRDRCDVVAAGVGTLASLIRAMRPDAVVNCTGRLDGSATDLTTANTLVTAKLVDAVERSGAAARLVRLGSAGEYGRVSRAHPVAEDDPAVPVSEYGLSQLAATRLVELGRAAGRVEGVSLRVFNPIGPGLGDQTLLGRAASRLWEALLRGTDTIETGPLSSSRDFVDVRDLARAVVAAAVAPSLPTAVVNIGSGQAVVAREAVHLLADVAGFTGTVREADAPPGRSAAVDWICADITRAAQVLGWRPAVPLAESVQALWADVTTAAGQPVGAGR